MEKNTDVGICTPKILNRDGSLQRQCRRSFARPWDVITYFLHLDRLFPHSELFGRYLLTYKPENEQYDVDAVSGSCMFIRREVISDIGYLDERYFAYQEDADFCFQAKRKGWRIVYYPNAEIIHWGGLGGSRFRPYRAVYEWHKSYFLYYRKNLAKDYFFLVNWLMYLAMILKLSF
jgi:GT2 family glycosyltransferase